MAYVWVLKLVFGLKAWCMCLDTRFALRGEDFGLDARFKPQDWYFGLGVTFWPERWDLDWDFFLVNFASLKLSCY